MLLRVVFGRTEVSIHSSIFSNIEYTYPEVLVEPTLHDVTITLPQGWTTALLVITDHQLKTTLARLCMVWLITAWQGVINQFLDILLHKNATDVPPNLFDFAVAYDDAANALERELSLEDDWPWRFETLSCSQQKRLQVACYGHHLTFLCGMSPAIMWMCQAKHALSTHHRGLGAWCAYFTW